MFTNRLKFLTQFIARSLHRTRVLHCNEYCREAPQPFYSISESLSQRLSALRCHQCPDHCTPDTHSLNRTRKAPTCTVGCTRPCFIYLQGVTLSKTQTSKGRGECFPPLLWSYSIQNHRLKKIKHKFVDHQPLHKCDYAGLGRAGTGRTDQKHKSCSRSSRPRWAVLHSPRRHGSRSILICLSTLQTRQLCLRKNSGLLSCASKPDPAGLVRSSVHGGVGYALGKPHKL